MGIGTRQGCLVSPLLFIIYVNTILDMAASSGKNGIFVDETFDNVSALLYADDLNKLSDTVGHLQNLINSLSDFCQKWGLSVNLSKTKVMVFRRGGVLKKNEKWFLQSRKIEVTTYYKYLGLTFSSRLSWTMGQKTLAAQAHKVVAFILQVSRKVKCFDVEMLWMLFDKMVLPILTYGSEIWGVNTHNCIERVQNKFCKYVLKLPIQTPNVAARGECGRCPLKSTCILHALKYWCKLLYMEDGKLPKSCYKMLCRLDDIGRKTWASNIKTILYNLGFGICWLSQDIGNTTAFLSEVKQRLVDIAQQEWCAEINELSKLNNLSQFKSLLEPELYIKCVSVVNHRTALAKLRCSVHSLAIETGRHANIIPELRMCIYCNRIGENLIEDEYHFVFICPLYSPLRRALIPNYFTAIPTSERFINLFMSNDPEVIKKLACFVYHAFKLRESTFVNL